MFVLNASKAFLHVLQRELITSGAVHTFQCQFQFNDDWDGLDKTAVFCAGKDKISVVLGPDDTCDIPWEVLRNTCADLHVGVYGTRDDALILPTIWAHLGQIKPGASPGTSATPPTPDVYSQILAAATSAEELAQSVRDDADAGKFDGPEGPPGPAGVGLPTVTEADDGKIARVKDGVWVADNAPSGGVQPDWNQNDSEAADYIKNRPGAYQIAGESVERILPELDPELAVPGGFYAAMIDPPIEIVPGHTYTVSYGGDTFLRVAAQIQTGNQVIRCIGNSNFIDGELESSGDPFVIATLSTDQDVVYGMFAARATNPEELVGQTLAVSPHIVQKISSSFIENGIEFVTFSTSGPRSATARDASPLTADRTYQEMLSFLQSGATLFAKLYHPYIGNGATFILPCSGIDLDLVIKFYGFYALRKDYPPLFSEIKVRPDGYIVYNKTEAVGSSIVSAIEKGLML